MGKKGLKSFENIMPQFLGIIVLIGILLSVFNSDTISKIIGKESGFIGVPSGKCGFTTLRNFPDFLI